MHNDNDSNHHPRGPRFGGARQHHGAGFPGRDRGDHEHGGRGGRGFGPGFGPGMGFGPGFGGFGGPGFGRERRRRGDVRLAILGLLAEGPQNGYAVIKTIAERTGGAWKPSPGSVYPTLQQLVDEDLVVSSGDGRKTLFELTDAGKAEAEAKADEIAAALDAAPGSRTRSASSSRRSGRPWASCRCTGRPRRRTRPRPPPPRSTSSARTSCRSSPTDVGTHEREARCQLAPCLPSIVWSRPPRDSA
ncbi:PadR family transcriptional regulator [Curtobacterium sp. 24E2]